MIIYNFKCTLLSDIVISSSSATEGFHPSLDYIPGAKFWGIVAHQLYKNTDNNNSQRLLNLFHNGKVKFGDAHLEINGKRSHKIPLSWFRDKHHPDAGIYIHDKVDYKEITGNGVQPEQLPGEYFIDTGVTAKTIQEFTIKSAYDSAKRRSEDEKMFGYYALPRGSIWLFDVSSDDQKLLEEVKQSLEGRKRIGRSRSAEYGMAEIKFQEKSKRADERIKPGEHLLYADSAIMLPIDCTLEEAIGSAEIDFSKSKIRTRIYQSWNTHRNTRDTDRQIIEKGSVISIKVDTEIKSEELVKGLNERASEGFGQILIDPDFLTKVRENYYLNIELKDNSQTSQSVALSDYISLTQVDSALLNILARRKEQYDLVNNVNIAVNSFVNNETNRRIFRSVTSSQWGTVRAMAHLFTNQHNLSRQLYAPGDNSTRKGFLVSGIAEDKWKAGLSIIKDIVEGRGDYPYPRHLFLEKLAAEMAKQKNK